MELNPVLERFAQRSPLPVMARAVLERCLNAQELDAWFEQVAQAQYTRTLLFSSVYELMTQVVLRQRGSVRAAWLAAEGSTGVSLAALYGKFNTLEVGTSAALVEYSAERVAELIAQWPQGRCSGLLEGMPVRMLDGNSIAGFFEVRDTLGTRLAWTASTTTPWLCLKSASGSAGSAVEYAIDVAQTDMLPNFADFEARVTINAQGAAGLPLAPVVASVTLRRDVAEVHTVSPAQIVAGTSTEVMVRGRGFDRLSFADLQWINVTGSVVNQVIRLSDTTLKVTLSPPSAGEIVVTLPNYQGVSISTATARAFDARALPAAALAIGGSPRSVLHDAVRRQLFVANTGLGAIQRFCETAGGWAVDKLADLFDIGFSPDSTWLVATERSGKLHLIDPAAFTIGASYTAPGALYPIPCSGHGIAVTNDSRAWLTVAGGSGNSMVSFDLRGRSFTTERPVGVAATFDGGPWYEASRNGEHFSGGIKPRTAWRAGFSAGKRAGAGAFRRPTRPA